MGQEVIDIVPPEVKDWAIDWFGTADKAVLILGTIISLAVIGSIVGNLAVKGQRAAAYAVTSIVGLIGVYRGGHAAGAHVRQDAAADHRHVGVDRRDLVAGATAAARPRLVVAR